jgi:hypothetical protein
LEQPGDSTGTGARVARSTAREKLLKPLKPFGGLSDVAAAR